MSVAEKIAELSEWPKEENYVTPMKLASGIQVTYSYPADEIRCLSDQLDAALERIALAREWIKNHYCTTDCGKWERGDCTCGRDALLKALEIK